MRTTEPAEEELALAKESLARSLPSQFETTAHSASTIGELFIYGLPLDYYAALPAQIDAVTAADVRRAAEKHLRPGQLVIVAVGDAGQIEAQLRGLDYGPIEVLDIEGKPVR